MRVDDGKPVEPGGFVEAATEWLRCACGELYPHTPFATECRDCTRLRRIVAEVISDHPAIRHIAGKP